MTKGVLSVYFSMDLDSVIAGNSFSFVSFELQTKEELVSASLSVEISTSFRQVLEALVSSEIASSRAVSRFFVRSSVSFQSYGCENKKIKISLR